MNLEVQLVVDVAIVRLRERRLVFPHLEKFASVVKKQLDRGATKLVLNLSDVDYLDSPAHGCLFDLYRAVTERGGTLKLAGLRPRVEAMAKLVGVTHLFEVYPDEVAAVGSFSSTTGEDRVNSHI